MSAESRIVLAGAGAGLVAGLLGAVVALVAVEPSISGAIDYESMRSAAEAAVGSGTGGDHHAMLDAGAAHDHGGGEEEVVPRGVQATLGVFLSVGLFGMAMGLLIAVAAYAVLKLLPQLPARRAALVAGSLAFVAGFLVPYAKYPSNPPAIGSHDDLVARTVAYYSMVAISVFAMVIAVVVATRLAKRWSWFSATLAVGAGYLVVVIVAATFLPSVAEIVGAASEIPGPVTDGDEIILDGYPAAVLGGFRLGSLLVATTIFGVATVLLAALVGGRGGDRPVPVAALQAGAGDPVLSR
ncbi:CbtA family protein [Microbacterium sp. SORGH_AS_0888]|uniref:CbtA family protein n=1 Tax=Microbacterium sp. SORGH_AS_0888 TaxID=3041791 RepID=UPI00278829A8|nr:CbtA family protein [Microbacterium sp. SORGH_AS_0888]MDQ1128101.1 hypothetical protein [Microbacterium sp. SORGH_AS_0888]